VHANVLEMPLPECSEDDHRAMPTSTCQVAPPVSRARNRSSGVLGNRGIGKTADPRQVRPTPGSRAEEAIAKAQQSQPFSGSNLLPQLPLPDKIAA
jgi:hypothetical protein